MKRMKKRGKKPLSRRRTRSGKHTPSVSRQDAAQGRQSSAAILQQAMNRLRYGGGEAALSYLRDYLCDDTSDNLVAYLLVMAQRVQLAFPRASLALVEAAIDHNPDSMQAWLLCGELQDMLGQRQRAVQSLLRVVQAAHSVPEQRLRAAHLLARYEQQGVALRVARDAYEQMGRPPEWATVLLYIAQRMADWDTTEYLVALMREAYATGQGERLGETPRAHLNWCDDESTNVALLKDLRARSFPVQDDSNWVAPKPLKDRRVRVGYLSSDFREHPTARLVMGLLRHHDQSAFEVNLYCSGWDDGSALRAKIESLADQVFAVSDLADEQAAALMREHQLDVLVELNGPTRAHRLGILSYRPAPVQVGYLGWPGSYGGGLVDYVVADSYVLPTKRAVLYPEKIIRLAHTYQVNDYAVRVRPPKPDRHAVGLPADDRPVLGMFNAVSKVHREVWSAWMQILQKVPEAVLWVLDPGPGAAGFLAKATKVHGVATNRVILAPRCVQDEHLARLQCCDLILDPWPYGGHTSTSDALFAGVPVVALEGRNFASRVSGSLLRAAGLSVFVQPDVASYVRFAVRLLSGSPDLSRARAFLNEQVPDSDVFDAKSKARQLEWAYRQALEACLSGQKRGDLNGSPWRGAEGDTRLVADEKTGGVTNGDEAPAWAAEMLVLDPGLTRSPGHHQGLDQALLDYAQNKGWRWTLLVHNTAQFEHPMVVRCFRGGAYVSGRDWLDWQCRSAELAAQFAADLQAHVTPLLAKADRVPGLLLPSVTLPLLIGLVRWLEGLPPGVHLPRLGLHFHAPPDLGVDDSTMVAGLSKGVVQRLCRLFSDGIVKAPLFTVEHPALINPWLSTGLSHVVEANSPTAWIRARRQRPHGKQLRLLFIGAPRGEKGIYELVNALPLLLDVLSDLAVRLVLSGVNEQSEGLFRALVCDRVSVRLEETLSSADFYQELADADAVYCAYRPDRYFNKSSGIFQEAQALGIPALVTERTGAAQELDAVCGKGGVAVADLEVRSLVRGCESLIERIATLRAQAEALAPRYAEKKSGRFWLAAHSRSVMVVNTSGCHDQPRFSVQMSGQLVLPRQYRGSAVGEDLCEMAGQQQAVFECLRDNPHPNIACVYDFDAVHFYMELVDGLVLLNSDPLCPPQHECCYVKEHGAIDLAGLDRALRHLHDLGIAHTALTGHHVMVTREGVIKLIGLAGCVPLTPELRRYDHQCLRQLRAEIGRLLQPDSAPFVPVSGIKEANTALMAIPQAEQVIPKRAFFTVVSKKHLAGARVLHNALAVLHPDIPRFVILGDQVEDCFDPALEAFTTICVTDLVIPQMQAMLFRYDAKDLTAALKPFGFDHLINVLGFSQVIYFDSDVWPFTPLDSIWRQLHSNSILLTPHLLEPAGNEVLINQAGVFNSGFVGVSARPSGLRFVQWWKRRLARYCYRDQALSLVRDQKWLNLVPTLFDDVNVLRSPIYNIAYWNFEARASKLAYADGLLFYNDQPASFFHFSGFDVEQPSLVSKYAPNLMLTDVPMIQSLFLDYRDRILKAGYLEAIRWPYAYSRFGNGVGIAPVMRRLYSALSGARLFGDPFDCDAFCSFYSWLNRAVDPAPGDWFLKRLSNFQSALHQLSPEVRQRFPDLSGGALLHYRQWLEGQGEQVLQLDQRFLVEPDQPTVSRPSLRLGVNVSGLFGSISGLGGTARLNTKALESAGVPVVLNQVDLLYLSRVDFEHECLSTENPYPINLIHINAHDFESFYKAVGTQYFRDRYNIVLWWWELEAIPKRWLGLFDLVDEIWTQSEFCRQIFASATSAPVYRFPHPIDINPHIDPMPLEQFGIQQEGFTFLFSFDYLSTLGRKNPLDLIVAFRKAFGSSRDACLIIKSVHGRDRPQQEAMLRSFAHGLNVVFLDEDLSREGFLGLLAACDCYVSLHRAEGLGLGMAEAMCLGKPVIATGYSGNLDFLSEETGFLVQWKSVKIERDEGAYRQGMSWAQPDVDHAAELMCQVFNNREDAEKKAKLGAQKIRGEFTLDQTGEKMKDRLSEILTSLRARSR